ncbi:hypothetical protein JK364_23915 [Streptomyces sp. 110]|uniref:Uncharacterized protein n=1 Tax=Streptomyces endocoffeicus TaxID=2898945 RepID=A0ABS1PUL8_9ACTN|nr:hypothetical protein [Streptomyces endocoffeicus]MBL1115421.1 hypothetical protein [Streptomyces endocoffeicus]
MIVFVPGLFAYDGDEITGTEKQMLDELHLRKIDLADEALVVDPSGYAGESTSVFEAMAEGDLADLRQDPGEGIVLAQICKAAHIQATPDGPE